MSNTHFTFKQFRIDQDACAMKVSTDACIFGAYTPIADEALQVLDIGTGTGLLSLMLAQRNPTIQIDAIEIDEAAAAQAARNVEASKFASRIEIVQGDVTKYPFIRQYDLIICNPPFFQNSLLGDDEQRNVARHTLRLKYADIIAVVKSVMKEEGHMSILLPYSEWPSWEELTAQDGIHSNTILYIHPSTGKHPNRVVCCSSFRQKDRVEQHLYIRDKDGEYTNEFQELMAPYYLFL